MKEEEIKKEKKKIKIDLKNVFMVVLDYLLIIFSYVFSIIILSETNYNLVSFDVLRAIVSITPFYALFVIIILFVFKLYLNDYMKIGASEARRLIFITAITCVLYALLMLWLEEEFPHQNFPHTFYVIGGMLQLTFTMGVRFFRRLITISENNTKEAAQTE